MKVSIIFRLQHITRYYDTTQFPAGLYLDGKFDRTLGLAEIQKAMETFKIGKYPLSFSQVRRILHVMKKRGLIQDTESSPLTYRIRVVYEVPGIQRLGTKRFTNHQEWHRAISSMITKGYREVSRKVESLPDGMQQVATLQCRYQIMYQETCLDLENEAPRKVMSVRRSILKMQSVDMSENWVDLGVSVDVRRFPKFVEIWQEYQSTLFSTWPVLTFRYSWCKHEGKILLDIK